MAAKVWFTRPDGVSVDLNDQVNTFAMVGLDGEMMPGFEFQEATSPLIAGSVVQAVRAQPRTFDLPVMVLDVDWPGALARARNLAKSLNPGLGEGKLYMNFSADPAAARYMNCRYREGWSGDGNEENQFSHYIRAALRFYAADPFWYDLSPVALWTTNPITTAIFFGATFFPIAFQASAGNASATLTNNGDVPAWPVFAITGPGTRFVATNTTTGKVLDVNATLAAGDTLTIDTRPRTRSVKDGAGVNRFAYLTAGSSLWGLAPGANEVTLAITSGTAASGFSMAADVPYLTA